MPNIDWIEIFCEKRGSNRTSPICIEDAQVCFEAGDRVRFSTAGRGRLTGTVEKLNPKRARVRCGADVWTVPYIGLDLASSTIANERRRRMAPTLRALVFWPRSP